MAGVTALTQREAPERGTKTRRAAVAQQGDGGQADSPAMNFWQDTPFLQLYLDSSLA